MRLGCRGLAQTPLDCHSPQAAPGPPRKCTKLHPRRAGSKRRAAKNMGRLSAGLGLHLLRHRKYAGEAGG